MQRKVLIIDDYDDIASKLEGKFAHLGHSVRVVNHDFRDIPARELSDFDIVICDLDNRNGDKKTVKAFKISATNFRRDDFNENELKELFSLILKEKAVIDEHEAVIDFKEKIEFELPSAISLMHTILDYLMRRVEIVGIIDTENSNLFVALDEAFVNAIKHGNKFDTKKLVKISAEVSAKEAKFTIEDQGSGFDVKSIPNPLDPENLFKTSGRGVLFIHNIMDKVSYNKRGNKLTMIKKKTN